MHKVIKWEGHPGRYIIVDGSGKTLDDAQGWGYKSFQNAQKAWAYKNRDKSKDKEIRKRRNVVRSWLKEHPQIVNYVEDDLFYALKDGEDVSLNVAYIRGLLKQLNIETDHKLTDIVWVLKNG